MSYTPIDNILGQPIPDYALNQLKVRTKKTLGVRDDQALVYTANKSAWVRVVSSVDITGSISGVERDRVVTGQELAQENVLFGGVSAYKKDGKMVSYELKPYYSDDPAKQRKDQFDSEYGFRPMPGITSAKISTQGRLGSILIAEIDFKVNTKQQLDMVDILYFKIGYHMLVEWGNTFYYKHKNNPNNDLDVEPTLYKSEDSSIDPFLSSLDKETIRVQIAKNVKETQGNYCAMLGIVTNYSFSMNVDGGYDCKIKVMGPGMLAESMRVNGISTLPKLIFEQAIENLANTLNNINRTNAEIERNRAIKEAKSDVNNLDNYPPCVRNLVGSLLEKGTSPNGQVSVYGKKESKLAGYSFYINNRYNYNNKTKDYYCDQNTNRIIDKDTGKPLPGQQMTEREFIEGIKNKTLAPSRYKLDGVYESGTGTLVVGYTIYDTQDKIRYYYDIGKQKLLVIDNTNDSTTGDYKGNKAKLSVDNNSIFVFSPNNLLTVLNEKNGGKQYGNFKLTSYDPSDSISGILSFLGIGGKDTTLYKGSYIIPIKNVERFFNVRYPNSFGSVRDIENTIKIKSEEENRQAIESAIYDYINNKNNEYNIELFTLGARSGNITQLLNLTLSATVTANIWINKKISDVEADRTVIQSKEAVSVKFFIETDDLSLISEYRIDNKSLGFIDSVPQRAQQQAATEQAPEQPLEYEQINASELVKSEASMYKSQLEAILRIIQVTTISETINNDGTLDRVKKIEWTDDKHQERLYDGLFTQGAMHSTNASILKEVVNDPLKNIVTQNNKTAYVNSSLDKLTRYKINLYYGFHRGLMKTAAGDTFETLDKPEYKVNFKELMTSYVIPYVQSKNLVEGGNIHYPTYVPLGFFFMMLNHCSFLYDTTDAGVNIPMFYLDFNPGSNVMLSSDFMLTANPYKFVVPFTGDIKSYKKLFDKELIDEKNGTIGSKENSSSIWKLDSVSNYIPSFKYKDDASNENTYRGKIMNVLVSIDYLLDVIKRHSTVDETNSVYFRPLIEELLSDMGKCLGSFNIFRLAYDDSSNCFYAVDDQTIPGQQVYDEIKNDNELPLFGKESIARSFTITTENSSKLGSSMFIGGNADVKNQTTLGIDATAIGGLSLFAIDRYKKVVTAANDNEKNKDESKSKNEQKATAASRFNQAVESYYYGGLESENMVDQSVNYYIEAVAKARNSEEDVNLRATMLLPLSVNFSTDGMSAMAIYQSFTINDSLLPYSYKYGLNQSETRKLGFIITGLEHAIQNNTWTTDVKANMYYVKRKGAYTTKSGNQTIGEKFKDLPAVLLSDASNAVVTGPINYRTNFVASKEQKAIDARRIAETYYGKQFTDNDWNCLIAASYAESDYNDREKQSAWCAAVIINRARISKDTIYQELTKQNQFQSVTGTAKDGRRPSANYVNGPSASVAFLIYDGIIKYMKKSEIDYRYTRFTSNLNSAYGPGTDIGYKKTLERSSGKIVVGNTIFAYG
jgi:hypothetical protein